MAIWEWAQSESICLSHVNAHQKVTTIEGVLNNQANKMT